MYKTWDSDEFGEFLSEILETPVIRNDDTSSWEWDNQEYALYCGDSSFIDLPFLAGLAGFIPTGNFLEEYKKEMEVVTKYINK